MPLGEHPSSTPIEDAIEFGLATGWTSTFGEPPIMTEPKPLTCREHQVAELIAANLTNAAIAGRLGIARRTVDTHVNRVLHKLAVSSRLEVGSALLRTGEPRTHT